MTWVWGLGPELLQVTVSGDSLPEGGDPYSVSHIPVSGRRWVSLLFNSTATGHPVGCRVGVWAKLRKTKRVTVY